MTDAGTSAIEHLAAISEHLIAGRHPSAEWFAAGLATYVAGAPHGARFDEALGLICAAGGRPWWRLEMMQRRDGLYRLIAGRFYPEVKTRAGQAKAIVVKLRRYQTTAWRADRAFKAPPRQYAGQVEEMLFRLLKLSAPLSEDRIRRILAAGAAHEKLVTSYPLLLTSRTRELHHHEVLARP